MKKAEKKQEVILRSAKFLFAVDVLRLIDSIYYYWRGM